MGKTTRAVLTLLLTPSLSLAFQDMPTISSTLLPMFYSGLVFIGLELYVFSRTLKTKKLDLIKIIGSVYVCTFIFMIAFSWVGMGLHRLLEKLLGRPIGVYVGLHDPSPWDVIYMSSANVIFQCPRQVYFPVWQSTGFLLVHNCLLWASSFSI